MNLLPKWCDTTARILAEQTNRHYKGKPSTPWNQLWQAQDECPKTIYYLDHFIVTTSEGLECNIGLLPEDQLQKKRKPRKPALKVCPHCGQSLIAA